MTTSSYMPDVKVEVAFNAGVGTAATLWIWTDISTYVELDRGIGITFGRADERATADANQLSLTLDNRDGRFTAGRSSSPYYPNVRLGRPIRVTSTPPGGSPSIRFTGYVDEWPVQWDGSDAYAYATVSATSRLARLGTSTRFRSVIEEEIGYLSPAGYYPLGEPSGATTAWDTSANGTGSLTVTGGAVAFAGADGPTTDGLQAPVFDSTGYLSGAISVSNRGLSVTVTFSVTALPASGVADIVALRATGADVRQMPLIGVTSAGAVVIGNRQVDVSTSTYSTVTSSISLATTYTAVLTVAADGTITGYLNGASLGTVANTSTSGTLTSLWVGGNTEAEKFQGWAAHVAVFPSALTAGQVTEISSAALTGFAGESTDTRLERYARWAGVPTAEVAADTSLVTMSHVDITGSDVLSAMRVVESTELGALYDDRSGVLTLRGRSSRYTPASSLSLDMTAQQVGTDYAPKYDRLGLVNDATVSSVDGLATARVTSATSIADYGVAGASLTIGSDIPSAPVELASWLVYAYAEPSPRVSSLTVDVLNSGVSQASLLGLTIGSLLTVTNQPTQSAATSSAYFVEGYTESVGPETYTLTLNVSPPWLYNTTLILDSATRGLLNTNQIAL